MMIIIIIPVLCSRRFFHSLLVLGSGLCYYQGGSETMESGSSLTKYIPRWTLLIDFPPRRHRFASTLFLFLPPQVYLSDASQTSTLLPLAVRPADWNMLLFTCFTVTPTPTEEIRACWKLIRSFDDSLAPHSMFRSEKTVFVCFFPLEIASMDRLALPFGQSA